MTNQKKKAVTLTLLVLLIVLAILGGAIFKLGLLNKTPRASQDVSLNLDATSKTANTRETLEATVEFPQSASPYNDGVSTTLDDGWIITNAEQRGESGTILSYELEEGVRYRISSMGKTVAGVINTKAVDVFGQEQYWGAPQKLDGRLILGSNDYKVLIFGNDEYRYELYKLQFTSCRDCLTLAEGKSQALNILQNIVHDAEDIRLYQPSALNVSQQAKDAIISGGVGDTASGVYITYALNSDMQYSIDLDGAVIEGRPSIRVTKNANAPEYFPADEVDGLVIEGVSSLEILIYSDRPYKYRFYGLKLTP